MIILLSMMYNPVQLLYSCSSSSICLTHQAPIRTEQAGNWALDKLHPPHLPNEQAVNARMIIRILFHPA
jgi:hypothetical protein